MIKMNTSLMSMDNGRRFRWVIASPRTSRCHWADDRGTLDYILVQLTRIQPTPTIDMSSSTTASQEELKANRVPLGWRDSCSACVVILFATSIQVTYLSRPMILSLPVISVIIISSTSLSLSNLLTSE